MKIYRRLTAAICSDVLRLAATIAHATGNHLDLASTTMRRWVW